MSELSTLLAERQILDEMEESLLAWMQLEEKKHSTLTVRLIKNKAMEIHSSLIRCRNDITPFRATTRWFRDFKDRFCLAKQKPDAPDRQADAPPEPSRKTPTPEEVTIAFRCIDEALAEFEETQSGDADFIEIKRQIYEALAPYRGLASQQ